MGNSHLKNIDILLEWGFYILFFFTPLLLTTVNYELFEFNKMLFVYLITASLLFFWVLKIFVSGKLQIKKNPFYLPLILFLSSQLLSSIFTLDRYTSIWGYYSRFHGGLISTVCYLILFFIFFNNFPSRKIKYLFAVILTSGFFVSIYAILERFGIDKNLWVQDVQNRVFSTLGQPNWLAAYLDILIFLSLGIGLFIFFSNSDFLNTNHESINKIKIFLTFNFWSFILIIFMRFAISQSWYFLFLPVFLPLSIYLESRFFSKIWFYFLAIFFRFIPIKKVVLFLTFYLLPFVFYLSLLFTKSRSGFIAFWASMGLFLVLILLKSTVARTIKFLTSIILLFFLITFLVGTPFDLLNKFTIGGFFKVQNSVEKSDLNNTSTLLDTGITSSGDIRKIVWKGAWDVFIHHPLIGTGVESFAYAYYLYRPVEHNLTSEWDFLYNKAHNEYLNLLANNGILGFGFYLVFIISYLIWFGKVIINTKTENYLLVGLFSAWTTILISNFFGFSVVVVALFFFLIPVLSLLLSEKDKILNTYLNINLPAFKNPLQRNIALGIFLFIFLYCLTFLGRVWIADFYFAKGENFSKNMEIQDAYNSFKIAVIINPLVPLYHSELSYASSQLAAISFKNGQLGESSTMLNYALEENKRTLQMAPNNVNFYKTATKLYFELVTIDEKYTLDAIQILEKAKTLSPTDPKIDYNLGILYGRLGQNEKAILSFQKAAVLKPNYKDAYYALALFYEQAGDIPRARRHLQEILNKIDANDSEIRKKLNQLEKKL